MKKYVKEIMEILEISDFPDVFPEDLPGLPPVQQVEFKIDLILEAALVAKSLYKTATTEM